MQETLERKQIKNIDFNCDLAQSFGVYKNSSEYQLLDYVSSVNISCGFHAGDPMSIKEALLKAKEKNVVVGAHIGFDDIQGFGYRPMDLSEDEVDRMWGAERLKQLEAVLQDIDITNDEYIQLFSDQGIQF